MFFPWWVFYQCHHKLICRSKVVAAPTSLLWLRNNHRLAQRQRLEGSSGDHLVNPRLRAQSAGAGCSQPWPVLKISEERDSTASLDNLCPCLTTLLGHPRKVLAFLSTRAYFMINSLPTIAVRWKPVELHSRWWTPNLCQCLGLFLPSVGVEHLPLLNLIRASQLIPQPMEVPLNVSSALWYQTHWNVNT